MGRYQKLFITGCPKSGTTWLVNSLNGHPQIVANGEGRFGWRLFQYVQRGVNAFHEDHEASGGSPLGKISNGEMTMILRSISDNVFLRYLNAGKKLPDSVRVVADKTPQHIIEYCALRTIYPTCRFINIVRDPRDAAASALYHLAKNDPRSKEQYVQAFINETWRMHVEAAVRAEADLGSDGILNIRYEDLHHDEAAVLKKCLQLIGVDSSDEIVRNCSEAGRFDRLSGGRQRGHADSNSFYRKGVVGDWMNHFTPRFAEQCCRPVADLMSRFGYAIDTSARVTVHVNSERAKMVA
jgi:hypothetical protein